MSEKNNQDFIRKIKKLPISIPILVTFICCYGFAILYSAAAGNLNPWAYKQIMVFSVVMPVCFCIALVDIKIIYSFSYIFYIITLIALIVVEFTGKTAMGATRWLDLGFVSLQPSELVKIAIIMVLARYFNENPECNLRDLSLVKPILLAILPILLVIKQPDLGTGMITLMVVVVLFFASGIRMIYFKVCAAIGLLSMPAIWYMMHDYQKNRVLTFLYPERDPLGTGYNIIQSKIAIGSGGLLGKGYMSGTQGHLRFLPEYQTDFIFSFLMEEMGFLGGMFLLFLYCLLIMRCLIVALNCRSRFASLLSIGLISLFFFHIFINIAMVMGMLPVVGIPLPLMSYGRTTMASILLGFGLIMNMAVNQYRNI